MNSWFCSLAALVSLVGVSPGTDDADPHREVVEKMLAVMGNITKTLKNIRDEDSAKAAREELKKSAEAWVDLRKSGENMAPPTREEKKKLVEKYGIKMKDAQKGLFIEIARVRLVPGGGEALTEIRSAFQSAGEEKPRVNWLPVGPGTMHDFLSHSFSDTAPPAVDRRGRLRR